jgi:hypothetical protein
VASRLAGTAFSPHAPVPPVPSCRHFLVLSQHRSYRAARGAAAATRIEAGPLHAELWPHIRNWTLHDARLNLTLHYMHSGALYLRDHMGMQTLTHPAFAHELHRLSLSKATPADRRPDIAVFGTSFHDDMQLGGPCGHAAKKDCEGAAQPMGDPASKSFPQNLTWPQRVERYRYHAAKAVRLITGVQAVGTRVVYLSLFPQSSDVDEYLRAVADDLLFAELKTAGFFAAGGRYMDQWPIYASYFELGRAHRAEWGPSTLHYAQLSNRGHMMTNDLTLARLTLLLNSWCTPAAEASSPRGVGSHFLPLAAYVRRLNASCSCGSLGMTRKVPQLSCRTKDAARNQADGRGSHPARANRHHIQSRRTIKKSEDLGLYGFLSLGLRPSPLLRRPQSQASRFLRPLPSQASLFLKVYF